MSELGHKEVFFKSGSCGRGGVGGNVTSPLNVAGRGLDWKSEEVTTSGH